MEESIYRDSPNRNSEAADARTSPDSSERMNYELVPAQPDVTKDIRISLKKTMLPHGYSGWCHNDTFRSSYCSTCDLFYKPTYQVKHVELQLSLCGAANASTSKVTSK